LEFRWKISRWLCSFPARYLTSHFRKASATQTTFPANRFLVSWSGVFGRSISASASGHEAELGCRARGGLLCLTFTDYHDRAGANTRAKPLQPSTVPRQAAHWHREGFKIPLAATTGCFPSPTAPAYNGCDPNQRTTYVNMGTSVGWEDIYDKMLFGQNFDVTDLMDQPQAEHFIRQTVDAAGILFEQDDSNNTTEIGVTLGVGVPYSTGGPRPGV
jgi:hypothetical protein